MNDEAKDWGISNDAAVARALQCEAALRAVKSALTEVLRQFQEVRVATDRLALELDSFGVEPGEELLEAARGVVRAVRKC